MLILVSNDDGIHAYGLPPLVEALRPLGEVWVVAPEREQSAQSHALTMHKPLRVRERGPREIAVSGTPADCVYLAVHSLLPRAPALVVSGINRGGNLGNDVLYSGTVAAAMEACLLGIPSIAVSMHVDWRVRAADHHWPTAASVAAGLARDVLDRGLPRRCLLNVNVPDVAPEALAGVVPARMGVRHYGAQVDARVDPRGRPYFWIGGQHERFEDIPDSDGPLIEQGFATVSPLQADLTAPSLLAALGSWPAFRRPAGP